MINQQILQGNWNEIKGKLRSKWGSLTDDDLMVAHGNMDQLVGAIQRKTGEARESIEQFFEQFNSNSAAAISRAGETVRAYAHQAAETVQETSKQAAASVREGYAEVEDMVRRRPAESLVVCFGAGVITGVVVGLLLRWREERKEQAVEKVMHESPETNAIRQRMEEVRCDLDEDVQAIVEDARDMGEWRSYVRAYPWVCLGAALVGGYLIVPRRPVGMQPDAQTLAELANQCRLLATSHLPPKGTARGKLLAFVGNLVLREGLSFVGHYAGRLIGTLAAKSQQDDRS